jgi:probable F420-dependent oxidoreductase
MAPGRRSAGEDHKVTEFGVFIGATEQSLQPVELAQLLEREGFDALFVGEHSHLPVGEHRYSGNGLTLGYEGFYDPFVFLTAAAAATQRIKLGTAVTLVTEHHPITQAKTVATLDKISNGRVVLGVGTGWHVAEMANYKIPFKDRWRYAREHILAMREIWTRDEAEFHGEFVAFEPLMSRPKPVQAGGPPVLIGGGLDPKVLARRIVDYGDGWIPLEGSLVDLEGTMAAIRAEADRAGRRIDPLNLTVGLGLRGPETVTARRIEEVRAMGFGRVIFCLDRDRGAALTQMEGYARLIAPLR